MLVLDIWSTTAKPFSPKQVGVGYWWNTHEPKNIDNTKVKKGGKAIKNKHKTVKIVNKKKEKTNIKRQQKSRDKDQGSGTWIASFHSLLPKANSLLILQSFKSLHGFLPCQVLSSSASLPITGPTYYPTMNRCLRGPPLDMSKPSQTMFHKLFLDWCNP
jgi:hypothetical protein